MAEELGGAAAALSGFLYEIVTLVGFRAAVLSGHTRNSDTGLEALLEGEVEHEAFQQDALAIDPDDRNVFIQFKFSRQQPLPSIGTDDVRDIVKALARSARDAKRAGRPIDKHVLVTNRPASDGALAMQAWPEKELRDYGLTKPQIEVVRRFRILPPYDFGEGESRLQRFAHDLGVTVAEFEEAHKRLVGELVYQTVRNVDQTISEVFLKQVFAGSSRARYLTHQAVGQLTCQEVGGQREHFGIEVEVHRPEVMRAINVGMATRSLIVLHGNGGSGKSVALWQWARDLVAREADASGVFTQLRIADQVPTRWVEHVVREWRDLDPDSDMDESPEESLQRLKLANPDVTPLILHLALDGLDERLIDSAERARVKQLLNWFWKEDTKGALQLAAERVVLVVTCRNLSDVLEKWIQPDWTGLGWPGQRPYDVSVESFSPSESLEGVRRQVHLSVRELLEPALIAANPWLRGHAHSQAPIRYGQAESPAPPIDPGLLDALTHPIVWGVFCRCNESQQQLALFGQRDAKGLLAQKVVRWFATKAMRREGGTFHSIERVEMVTKLIAKRARGAVSDRWFSYDVWANPVREHGPLRNFDLDGLFDEAVSSGLIEAGPGDPSDWRWQHHFVFEYLAPTPSEEASMT